MVKQIFYIVAVIVLMIIAFRLMKKVDDLPPPGNPHTLSEDSNEELVSDSEDTEDSEESISEEEGEAEK